MCGMGLPTGGTVHREVLLSNGEKALVRSLTRAEIHAMQNVDNEDWDLAVLGIIFGVSLEETREWAENFPGGDVLKLATAVMELSGLSDSEGNGENSNAG